jgi:hypothetical protein
MAEDTPAAKAPIASSESVGIEAFVFAMIAFAFLPTWWLRLPPSATECRAATCSIPDALLPCHRYDEILPPGAIQSCHLNESGLDYQTQPSNRRI